jgi:uncharacterized cupredoxin-like copper-binding protein
MKKHYFFALSLSLLCMGSAWAHEGAAHKTHHAAIIKEQKDWGIAGDAKAVQRTITIQMTDDMRFTPAHIDVQLGETLRLRAENKGKVLHEIVIGTKAELDAHAELMKKHPNMEHDEPYMAHVSPGKKGDVVWLFNRAGTFDFACLIPGHYTAGMRGTITVKAPANTIGAQP